MMQELSDMIEHLQRYRAVTLQALELVTDEQLDWRPGDDYYSLGQQFLHIAQAEDFNVRGVLEGDWSAERVRLPRQSPSRAELKAFYAEVRAHTLSLLERLEPQQLDSLPQVPDAPFEWTLRSWIWFVLEHELHHRGQVWLYLRQLGITPPFYAMPLTGQQRPDIAAREALGGF